MYEDTEEFELHLMDPSLSATLGNTDTAIVIIEGPNDGEYVWYLQTEKQSLWSYVEAIV